MKKSIVFVAAVIVVAGARWHYSRGSASIALSPAEKQSLHDAPSDGQETPKVDLQKLGLDSSDAPAVAPPLPAETTKKSVSGQQSGIQQLLQEQGISLSPGETGYDALRSLFEKGQAPSQADVTGSFLGQVFTEKDRDQALDHVAVGQEVAGAVSQKFEFAFTKKLESFEQAEFEEDLDMPDYTDSKTTLAEFGNDEMKVSFNVVDDVYLHDARTLKVRKVGSYLVAEVQSDHLRVASGKPTWIGYFQKK